MKSVKEVVVTHRMKTDKRYTTPLLAESYKEKDEIPVRAILKSTNPYIDPS